MDKIGRMKTMYEKFDEAFRNNIASGVQRIGQATFNAVYEIDPEIANQLRGTDKDCFYLDSRIDEFTKVVYERWDGYQQ